MLVLMHGPARIHLKMLFILFKLDRCSIVRRTFIINRLVYVVFHHLLMVVFRGLIMMRMVLLALTLMTLTLRD